MKRTFTSSTASIAITAFILVTSFTNDRGAVVVDAFPPKSMTKGLKMRVTPKYDIDTLAIMRKKDIVPHANTKSTGEWTPGTDNGHANYVAATVYAASTAFLMGALAVLIDINAANNITKPTIGLVTLALVTGTLIWDNLTTALASIFCRDIETNTFKYNLLKILSFPRIAFHALGVPLQLITVAEIGKFVGVGFLQSNLVQTVIKVVAFVVVSQA